MIGYITYKKTTADIPCALLDVWASSWVHPRGNGFDENSHFNMAASLTLARFRAKEQPECMKHLTEMLCLSTGAFAGQTLEIRPTAPPPLQEAHGSTVVVMNPSSSLMAASIAACLNLVASSSTTGGGGSQPKSASSVMQAPNLVVVHLGNALGIVHLIEHIRCELRWRCCITVGGI